MPSPFLPFRVLSVWRTQFFLFFLNPIINYKRHKPTLDRCAGSVFVYIVCWRNQCGQKAEWSFVEVMSLACRRELIFIYFLFVCGIYQYIHAIGVATNASVGGTYKKFFFWCLFVWMKNYFSVEKTALLLVTHTKLYLQVFVFGVAAVSRPTGTQQQT